MSERRQPARANDAADQSLPPFTARLIGWQAAHGPRGQFGIATMALEVAGMPIVIRGFRARSEGNRIVISPPWVRDSRGDPVPIVKLPPAVWEALLAEVKAMAAEYVTPAA